MKFLKFHGIQPNYNIIYCYPLSLFLLFQHILESKTVRFEILMNISASFSPAQSKPSKYHASFNQSLVNLG